MQTCSQLTRPCRHFTIRPSMPRIKTLNIDDPFFDLHRYKKFMGNDSETLSSPIESAIRKRDFVMAEIYAREMPLPSEKKLTVKQYPLLHLAYSFGMLSVVEILLERGMDACVEYRRTGRTLFHTVVKYSNMTGIRLLLKYGIEKVANKTDKDGMTPFSYAIRKRCIQTIRFILENVEVDRGSKSFENDIKWFIFNFNNNKNDRFILRFLISNNLTTFENDTGFIHIARKGNLSKIKIYTEEHKDTEKLLSEKEYNTGLSALMFAIRMQNSAVVEWLIKTYGSHCNYINNRDIYGRTALHWLFYSPGNFSSAEINRIAVMLYEANANINLVDITGESPLFYLARKATPENEDMIYSLFEVFGPSVDFNIANVDGMNILHVASRFGSSPNLIRYFVSECKISIYCGDNKGRTIAHLIALNAKIDTHTIAVLRYKLNLDFMEKDNFGIDALYYVDSTRAVDRQRFQMWGNLLNRLQLE